MYEYNGYPVWDHDHGPHEINDGEVDGEIDFGELKAEKESE